MEITASEVQKCRAVYTLQNTDVAARQAHDARTAKLMIRICKNLLIAQRKMRAAQIRLHNAEVNFSGIF